MPAEHPTYVWWNGQLTPWEQATVHVTDLAWSTIGAVFEGIRAYTGSKGDGLQVFRLREHIERLQESSRLVRMPLRQTTDEFMNVVVELLRKNVCAEDTYIFPMIYNSDRSRRFDPQGLEAEIIITTTPMPTHLGSDLKLNARTSTWTRISDTVMPPRVKSIPNYRNSQLANHEVRLDGYDVALMLNPQGKVAEAPGACVVHVRKGRLITPDVASGLLESITRDALITIAREDFGMDVVERAVDRTELYVADEVFLCGTAAEISPVISIDKYQIGDGEIGTVTRQLGRALNALMRGTSTARPEWRTSVGVPVLAD